MKKDLLPAEVLIYKTLKERGEASLQELYYILNTDPRSKYRVAIGPSPVEDILDLMEYADHIFWDRYTNTYKIKHDEEEEEDPDVSDLEFVEI